MAKIDSRRGDCNMTLDPTDPGRCIRREWTFSKPFRFVGKCKCGLGASMLAVARCDYGGKEWIIGETIAHQHDRLSMTLRIPCPCSRVVLAREVAGVFSARHVCDAKCMASKGHQCECACGGRNHGASWG